MRPYLRVANVYEDRLNLADVKRMNFTPAEFETWAEAQRRGIARSREDLAAQRKRREGSGGQ